MGRKLTKTRLILLGGAAVPLFAATMAWADTPATPGATSSASVEEITVTAQKRVQRLVDVPVAATVMNQTTLSNYNTVDLTALTGQLVGVNFAGNGEGNGGAALSIRGVGNLANDFGTEDPVAIVVDGLSINRGHVIDMAQFDLSDVEVLKGPQALFFGKNSPAGVVIVNSTQPGRTFTGYMRASYGLVTENPAIEGAVTIPINDTLSVRLAARFSDMLGGWVTNSAVPQPAPTGTPNLGPAYVGLIFPGAGTGNHKGPGDVYEDFRGTLKWTPNDKLTATWITEWDWHYNRNGFWASQLRSCRGAAPSLPTDRPKTSGGVVDPLGPCTVSSSRNYDPLPPAQELANFWPLFNPNQTFFNKTEQTLSSLTLAYKAGDVTFTSVSGYWTAGNSSADNSNLTEFALAFDYQNDTDVIFSEELRAESSFSGPLNFMAGLYLEHESLDAINTNDIATLGPITTDVTISPGPGIPGAPAAFQGVWNDDASQYRDRANTISPYAELEWKILPNLELDAGARYTDYNETTVFQMLFDRFDYAFGPRVSPFAPQGLQYTPKEHETNWSPQVTLTWHPEHDVTLYAAYKTGFLSGGAQNAGITPNLTYNVCAPGTSGSTCPHANALNRNIALENAALQYNAETVQGGEWGAKWVLLDGRFAGDATLYYYKYSNLQTIAFNPVTVTYSVFNAGASIDRGFEAEGSFQVDPHLTLRGQLEYSDLKYVSLLTQCYGGQTLAQGCSPVVINGKATTQQSLAGQAYGGPPLTLSGGFNYDHPVMEGVNGALNFDVLWHSKGTRTLNNPGTEGRQYTIVNASLRLYQPGTGWEVSIIGTNLNNSLGPLASGGAIPIAAATDWGTSIIPGREVTLEASYHF